MSTKITVTLLASILISGCSTTASISRTNGRELEAKIQRSTPGAVVVQTNGGSEVSISRSDITDIDHPGNASAVVGLLLSTYGAINIAAGAPKCSEGGGAFCTGVFLPAAIGFPMLIWGLSTWLGSSNAAASSPLVSGNVPDAPQASAFDFSPATHGGRASTLLAR
ncbi:hypothetical protein [Hyalangium sp.]|uniref:hypothetical protein n=1 Tax=Hyalangium sp. TaxID=2028555 RepID=UPI002D4E6706|nr:hypothetical protein [Hyalangium sp.]HYH96338.1 hypothetical protein [Hyalangium sp.]